MSANETKSETLHCSFCQKSQYEVTKLIAAPKVHICDDCIWFCMCIIADLPDDTPDQLYEEVVAFMQQRCSTDADESKDAR